MLILGAWAVGELIALAGAFIYANCPQVTGQAASMFHPRSSIRSWRFCGWSLLFVIQTGGMAAVALIFANHLFELPFMRVNSLGIT